MIFVKNKHSDVKRPVHAHNHWKLNPLCSQSPVLFTVPEAVCVRDGLCRTYKQDESIGDSTKD